MLISRIAATRTVLKSSNLRCFSSASDQKIKVYGHEINYAKATKSLNNTKAIILLPGALGSCWTDFKPQLEHLPNLLPKHQIISWDPPGYGKSYPPKKEFSIDFLEKDAEIVDQMMKELGFKTYDVLGWSDGGITGMILAGKYPKSVENLIVFGSNAYIVEEELKIYESIRDVNKWSAKMREPLEKLYGPEYFKTTWENWVDTFIKIYKENKGDLCKSKLKNIIAKTLILHGEKDPMLVAEHVPYLLKNIKNSKLITFPQGKHNIHLRYAEEFNKIVSDFITN